MGEEYLPGIPPEDLCNIIELSDKIIGVISAGSTYAFVLSGNSYIGKRTIYIRKGAGDVDYEYAIGISVRAGVLSQCMAWFEKNRSFKEGGYFVKTEGKDSSEDDRSR